MPSLSFPPSTCPGKAEAGSPYLKELLTRHRQTLSADAVLYTVPRHKHGGEQGTCAAGHQGEAQDQQSSKVQQVVVDAWVEVVGEQPPHNR